MTAPLLQVPPALEVAFSVGRPPVTQGSLRSLGKGRPAVHANAKTLKPYREAIAMVARHYMAEQTVTALPCVVTLTFCLPRPKTVKRLWPIGRGDGDIDKLARAVLDSLTATVYVDDAQVVDLNLRKVYAPDGWVGVMVGVRTVTP